MGEISEVPGNDEIEEGIFRPFTRQSLAKLEAHIKEDKAKRKERESVKRKYDEDNICDDDEGDPDPRLEDGNILPASFQENIPSSLISTPLEDIDPFYHNQRTYIVLNSKKEIFRFSSTRALWMLDPFSPLRRGAVSVMIHPIFSLFIIATVVANCLLLIMPETNATNKVMFGFYFIYLLEALVKILARGFTLKSFTYLRDPWNWLDFIVLICNFATFSSLTIDLNILRALKPIPLMHGLRVIAGALVKCTKNIGNALILTVFLLVILALTSVQMYMGVLTRKCIKEYPQDGSLGNITNAKWMDFSANHSNWYMVDGWDTPVCGNASGAGTCPDGYKCLESYGNNPNYGYTNFDTFGWAFLSCIRLVNLDFWEDLYRMILRATGPWNILFFMMTMFFGSFYLITLLLATIATTFEDLRKKAEEIEEADLQVIKNKKQKKEDQLSNNDNAVTVTSEEKDAMVLNDIVVDQAGDAQNGTSKQKNKMTPNHTKKTCLDVFCIWDCCRPWVQFQKFISYIIFDPFVELFVLICIILNTLFMALDHHDMDRDMERVLVTGNYFFTAVYCVEAVLKIIALSPKFYFKDSWNVFDFSIVAMSIVELGLEGVQGLSVLRTFRLLRVFRLAKSWRTQNELLKKMGRSTSALNYQSLFSCIVIFIFAQCGMSLFGANYIFNIDRFPDSVLPRWNFVDFFHSFMLVFRVLCGEWIESMWDCLLIGDVTCISYFLIVVVIGNLVVLNFFLALLLTNASSSSSTGADQGAENIMEAFKRMGRFFNFITGGIFKRKGGEKKTTNKGLDSSEVKESAEASTIFDSPPECCSACCYSCLPSSNGGSSSPFWHAWSDFRQRMYRIHSNRFFQFVITIVILVGSLILPFYDMLFEAIQKETLMEAFSIIEVCLAIFFALEMVIAWFAIGFKSYFSSGWHWVDFVVAVGFLSNILTSVHEHGGFLVALLPLRACSRFDNLKVVVVGLAHTLPGIFNVILPCSMFWFVFSIMGVQLFAGKFFKCVDENGTILSHELVPDRNVCYELNYTWENSPQNFDHVGNAFISLFQVATFKGWIQIMNDAIDSREVHKQPIRETNIYMYLYFVLFIVMCTFFTLNLVIGVVMDHMCKEKKKHGGVLAIFMTERQKKWYGESKKCQESTRSYRPMRKPRWMPQLATFKMVTSEIFDMLMMFVMVMNILILTFDHYKEADHFHFTFELLNFMFLIIYIMEALLKIFAMRNNYFSNPWNIFDFVMIILIIVGMAISYTIDGFVLFKSMIRIIKLFRLIGYLRGVRRLLLSFVRCIPALFNFCLVIFMVVYVYSLIGLTFVDVKARSVIDDVFNFKSFGSSLIIMFQLLTTAGWDGVMDAVTNEFDCSPQECGSVTFGTIFLISYVCVSFMIIINMFMAMILEYYFQTTEGNHKELSDDEYDSYYDTWKNFDPDGSQYIRLDQLENFLDALKSPLRIAKPNKEKILEMDIPICKGDLIFCVDILDAITKDTFAFKGSLVKDAEQEQGNANARTDVPGYEVVSSTMKRKREEDRAKIVQYARRRYEGLDEGVENVRDIEMRVGADKEKVHS